MKRWITAERIAYGLALVLAAGAFFSARHFPRVEGAPTGPGSFPLLLSLALAGLALAGLLFACRAYSPAQASASEPVDAPRLLVLGGLTAGYLLALPLFGFISATALFCAFVLAFLGYRHPVRVLAIGFVFAFALYGVFELLMNVTLPKGWIG
jgi:putative tricarboxylic transport membrane protein